ILTWSTGLMFPGKLLAEMAAQKLTGVSANPTAFRLIFDRSSGARPDLSGIRYVICGGQPFDGALAGDILDFFPKARITSMYGCTENSPRISHYWLPENPASRITPWPVGKPISGTEIKLADSNGKEVPIGKTGEILVRGASLMSRYWRAPDLTESRLVDGWFHTRDSGFIDTDGNLNYAGRLDNVFSVGHEKVSPEEVEAIIERISDVIEVAVGARRERLRLYVPVALLVTKKGRPFNEIVSDVKKLCKASLSAPKVPHEVIPVASIPRTAYGKIDRQGVKALIAGQAHEARKG
ncbi:MAG: fatty acid--CoA ligase family protein, partial [Planctomycetaceae bacterium]